MGRETWGQRGGLKWHRLRGHVEMGNVYCKEPKREATKEGEKRMETVRNGMGKWVQQGTEERKRGEEKRE